MSIILDRGRRAQEPLEVMTNDVGMDSTEVLVQHCKGIGVIEMVLALNSHLMKGQQMGVQAVRVVIIFLTVVLNAFLGEGKRGPILRSNM